MVLCCISIKCCECENYIVVMQDHLLLLGVFMPVVWERAIIVSCSLLSNGSPEKYEIP